MGEPIVIRPDMLCVHVDIRDATQSTALRELADWVDEQPREVELLLHTVWLDSNLEHLGAIFEVTGQYDPEEA